MLCLAVILMGCEPQILKSERAFVKKHVLTEELLKSFTVSVAGVDSHYVQIGSSQQVAVVFIHGTPGSWSHFGRFLVSQALRDDFQLVSIDRPGWGESFGAGVSFEAQALQINNILLELKRRGAPKVILVGHSLGASIAPKVAIDYPQSVDGLVLLAGTLSPALSKPRWYNKAANLGLVKVFLSPVMLQANREIEALEENIKNQAAGYSTIAQPIIVIQGDSDKLVSPANSEFAQAAFNQQTTSVLTLDNKGHLFLFEDPSIVINAIQTVSDSLSSR